jgi:hypothetical protein
MTEFVPHPNADGLVKLTGTIRNLKVTRAHASFVFTESDQTKMGVVAIAAAVAGLAGQAASTVISASDMEEAADYVEFELSGKQVRGWLWRNPFKDGDEVNVAAEPTLNGYEAFGIARKNDNIVALYPHCSRGRVRHYRNAVKWWLIVSVLTNGLIICLMKTPVDKLLAEGVLKWGMISFFSFFALMVFSLTRQWLPFVRLAEKVFRALELPNPSSIDLKKSSKQKRKPSDSTDYGIFYFRY